MEDGAKMQDQDDWYGPDAATFGDRLTAAREKAGLTQKDLSRRLGVKLKTLTDWESDLSEPRANKLSMIAGLLNVSIVWLLTGEGEGVSGPPEEELPADLTAVFTEIRDLKTQMTKSAERLGILEKRLRQRLKEELA
ncbi:Helix-turn-helix [Poseidonocella pacifica]|uniref:Helix-turn-helix n=1 Tax=Poseidonocella pacifica TaxID=871651 RepID=A0A1I0VUD6_9RHOB|nr:helix-turn-helix domain-containing protein [Poseidonocella pacifica]SFA79964.1 Helix-turn-helix [Poseidonocella pacifica]